MVAPIIIQYATLGIQILDAYATTIGSPCVDEVLLGIAPHPLTLPFMSIEGQIRYIEFMRIDLPYFDGDPRFDAYMYLLGC